MKLWKRFTAMLERLVLGKAAVRQLEAARKRIADSESREAQLDQDEAKAHADLYRLITRVRSRSGAGAVIPQLRPVTIPEIILDDEHDHPAR